ncbi:MAG TPA: spore germination protein GerW family protein [Actinomycetota bacterium]|nr:spore germination protein GerW family protein [Actinomycetota bacterium]
MAFDSVIGGARDALTVKRVFGDPYEKNGLTVIPAARIMGGGGGGSGDGPQDTGHGEGAGFGMAAKPAGVYVIHGDSVRWQPAVDVNRVILGAQVVAILALLTARTAIRVRGRRGSRKRS